MPNKRLSSSVDRPNNLITRNGFRLIIIKKCRLKSLLFLFSFVLTCDLLAMKVSQVDGHNPPLITSALDLLEKNLLNQSKSLLIIADKITNGPDYPIIDVESNEFTNFMIKSEPFAVPLVGIETMDSIDGLPACFGDFDSDSYMDIFMITGDGRNIRALKGENCVDGQTILTYFGSRKCLTKWANFYCQFEDKIVNVAASDFSGGNILDLLVTTLEQSLDSKERYSIYWVKGQVDSNSSFNCSDRKLLLTDAISEPFVLDYNGDMISDFIVSTTKCATLLWFGGNHLLSSLNSGIAYSVPPEPICLTNLTQQSGFSKPHSNAFVNLNKPSIDQTPDIYINGIDHIDYVFNMPGDGFSHVAGFSYPDASIRGQSLFIDINYDGLLEHLIPACLDKPVTPLLATCRNHAILMLDIPTKSWKNILLNSDDLGGKFFRNVSFFFNTRKVLNYLTIPATMRAADVNYDGYPDFAMVVQDLVNGSWLVAVFLNVPDEIHGRAFELTWLSAIPERVVLLSFFDLYTNGRLNLMVTTENEDHQLSSRVFDNFNEKYKYSSFLKVSLITGRCSDRINLIPCPIENKLAMGTNPPGPTVCFDGPFKNDRVCGAQLSQSGHFAMQLPFVVFGLGDVLNVVNNLKVSIANGKSRELFQEWDDNIPGSTVIVVPYSITDTDKWDIRIYITMSLYSLISMAFVVVLTIVLMISIYVLHLRERFEDRKDQEEYKKHWL